VQARPGVSQEEQLYNFRLGLRFNRKPPTDMVSLDVRNFASKWLLFGLGRGWCQFRGDLKT
jgi:hypothetical protein